MCPGPGYRKNAGRVPSDVASWAPRDDGRAWPAPARSIERPAAQTPVGTALTPARRRRTERRRPIISLPVLVLGVLLGMRHATDPDHVIAVATIVSRHRTTRSAAMIGTLWGIGHTVTVMLVGALIILFDVTVPARVGLAMEFGAALMLILLGISNVAGPLRRAIRARAAADGPADSPPHGRAGDIHAHPRLDPRAPGHSRHAPPLSRLDRAFGRLGLYQALRPVVVGLIHGLAGSAAAALLVLAAIRDPWWALAYLLLFGLGTIGGMMLITAIIALPFAYSARRFAVVNRGLGVAAGLLSLAVGLVLACQIGLGDGLFTADPRWTPR
jgi:high-affinity nickel-transport protein